MASPSDMTSGTSASRLASELERLERPSACFRGDDGTLVAMNDAFGCLMEQCGKLLRVEGECGNKRADGGGEARRRTLDSLLPTLFDSLPEMASPDVAQWVSMPGEASGRMVRVTCSRGEDGILFVTVDPLDGERQSMLLSAVDSLAQQAAIQRTLGKLGQEIALSRNKADLARGISEAIRSMFPGRRALVRMLSEEKDDASVLWSSGSVAEEHLRRIHVYRPLLAMNGVSEADIGSACVAVEDRAVSPFEDGRPSVSAPLVIGGEFYGQLDVERLDDDRLGNVPFMPLPDVPLMAMDPPARTWVEYREERALHDIAIQAAIGLRNARLLEKQIVVRRRIIDTVEQANALVMVTDGNGVVLGFNRMARESTGLSSDEILGHSLLDIVVPDDLETIREILAQTTAGKCVTNAEIAFRTKSGGVLQTALSSSPAVGIDNSVAFVGQDLSRIRFLESRVTHAEKLASLGQLSASVAHEISSPLMTVRMYAEALLQNAMVSDWPSEDTVKLQRICDATERIARFTKELTSYSRPSTDEMGAVSLQAVVDQAAIYSEHCFKTVGIRLVKDIPSGISPVRGVRDDLVQVLVNLLTNACHACKETKGTVTVTARQEADRVELAIEDKGKGISLTDLDNIFTPYFTTKNVFEGTGLGLSVVQRIVRKHGGRIRVESELGRGSVFRISLHVAPEAGGKGAGESGARPSGEDKP